MAKTDHTRLWAARSAAPERSTDNRRDPRHGIGAAPPPIADARSHRPTHSRWTLPAASRTATAAWEQPLERRQFLPEDTDSEAGTSTGLDADAEFEAAPTFSADQLREVCRAISDIHAALALAYAYGLTFQRAVRDFIPADTLDILPCLSIGVLDTLDLQLPRLDALLDHLARSAAVPAVRAFRKSPLRHSQRDADSAEAAFGQNAVRSTL